MARHARASSRRWAALEPQILAVELARARADVAAIFAGVMAPLQTDARPVAAQATGYVQRVADGSADAAVLHALGYHDAAALHAKVVALIHAAQTMSARGHARLNALLPTPIEDAPRAASAPMSVWIACCVCCTA